MNRDVDRIVLDRIRRHSFLLQKRGAILYVKAIVFAGRSVQFVLTDMLLDG